MPGRARCMYVILYFGDLTKHCAYGFMFMIFRYFRFQGEELDVTASHPPGFHIYVMICTFITILYIFIL